MEMTLANAELWTFAPTNCVTAHSCFLLFVLKALPPFHFLAQRAHGPLLDVRSPSEYAQGHIPGARSFPLFSDAERAEVGTLYKKKGKERAFERGLEIVGPKMADFVRQAAALAPERRVAVHCWRGGQRSGSMAWLLRQAGFEVATLAGGYKAYRQHLLEAFENMSLDLRVVGGRTGSGKTKILHALRDSGEQIIDLERLANHKGSAFGFIGEPAQPTVEQFENDLFDAMQALAPARRVWVENESRSVGRVYIPLGFWRRMKASPLFNVEIPESARIENLLQAYVLEDKKDLETAFLKISKKLGGQHLKMALEALAREDFATAARLALHYYDKTYQHGLDHNPSPDIRKMPFDHGDAVRIAAAIVEIAG
jgi:tRNA 2-selenouridine synthase